MFIYVQYKMKQELEMQILLREVSIVLKLLSRIIVVKFNFNLTRTFNYFSQLGLFFIFSVSRQFCNFYNVLYNITLVSGVGKQKKVKALNI